MTSMQLLPGFMPGADVGVRILRVVKRMGVFEEKIAASAGDMGERRFHREPDLVQLRAAARIAFCNGVQPVDGVAH
jgi:hypothetical protein